MQQTTTGNADSAAREKVEDRGAGMMDQAKLKAGEIYNQANRNLNEQYERVNSAAARVQQAPPRRCGTVEAAQRDIESASFSL